MWEGLRGSLPPQCYMAVSRWIHLAQFPNPPQALAKPLREGRLGRGDCPEVAEGWVYSVEAVCRGPVPSPRYERRHPMCRPEATKTWRGGWWARITDAFVGSVGCVAPSSIQDGKPPPCVSY